MDMEPKDRIILAMDVSSLHEARQLLEKVDGKLDRFKVGLEFITAEGSLRAVSIVHGNQGRVFYDGKFCDIPNTVGAASKNVASFGVEMFNVHASCGKKSIEAAVANRGKSLVLGVTVLTSIDEEECMSIFGDKPDVKVLQFARTLMEAGAHGIICSPKELLFLGKHSELDKMQKIVPGIRPDWAAVGDQKRVMTPAEAIKAGATALVIGRPITNPPEMIGGTKQAIAKILDEIVSMS